jgi:hypothetical protein
MSLLKNINKCIEKSIVQFTKDISEKYGMSQDELIEMWENVSKMKTKSIKSPTKKMSPWLQFCKDERARLKTEQPTLKFGEISKRIGEKWSAMSKDEKQSYCSTTANVNVVNIVDSETVITPSSENEDSNPTNDKSKKTKRGNNSNGNVTANSSSTNDKWTRENLEKMSINDLKELCESIKLSKTGKKAILIERLMNCSDDTVGSSTLPMSHIEESDYGGDSEDEDNRQCSFNYNYNSD